MTEQDSNDEWRSTKTKDVKIVQIKPQHLKISLKHSQDRLAPPATDKNLKEEDQSTPAKIPRQSETNKGKINTKWKCGLCTLTFSIWDDLNAHVKNAHEKTREKTKWQCRNCGRTYSTKGNLSKHMRMKQCIEPQKMMVINVLEATLKKSLIQFECILCRETEDKYDAAVHHAQVHLVQEALINENATQYKLAFDHHQKLCDVSNSSTMKIIFDYKSLLTDAWFDMFKDVSIPSEIITSSLFRHTRRVKLNCDFVKRENGKEHCVPLYKCGACNLFVEPAKVQNHCENHGACVALGAQGHTCPECQNDFHTPKALRLHKLDHDTYKHLRLRIVTFNNEGDEQFNNALRRMLLPSVTNTQAKDQQKIPKSPETPKSNVQYKHSYFDFEAHNAYYEDKTNRTLETSCSVKARAANRVSSVENVSHDENTRRDFLENRSKVQAHKENKVDASKKIDSGSIVTAWDSGSDSNDSNRPTPAQLNLNEKSFGEISPKKDEIIQNTSNDNINSIKNSNHDNITKEEIFGKNDEKDQSAFKRSRIPGESNNPRETLRAAESQTTDDQRVLEGDAESIHTRDMSKENEDFDHRYREIQEHKTGATASIGVVKKSVNGEGGALGSSYASINGNVAILHGSFHQDDLRFHSSRGKQCTGIAAVACAAFCVLDPNAWTKSIIDKIVVIGDKYYNQCIAARELPAAGEVNPDYLAVTDLMPKIIFNKLSVPIAVEENTNVNGHIDNDNSSKGFPNLMNGLKSFFRRHASGILTSNATSVAVFCKTVEHTYWLFDSHSRGTEGAPALGGAACCMRFSHLDDLHSLLRRNLFVSPSDVLKGRDLINNLNVFSLTSLSVIPSNGKLA